MMNGYRLAGRRPALITGILLMVLTIIVSGCSNPIDLLDAVKTEYMQANDLFLVVENFSPIANTIGVNPGGEIRITFDRAIDLDSLSPTSLQIVDNSKASADWIFVRYNSSTNSLYIKGDPFLENSTDYTISIVDLKGTDGSILNDAVSWSFTTGIFPAGSVTSITSTNGNSVAGYSNTTSVDVSIEGNILATGYILSNSYNEITDPDFYAVPGDYTTMTPNSTVDISSGDLDAVPLDGSAQGDSYIYARFMYFNGTEFVYSLPAGASIVYDTLAPNVSAGLDRVRRSAVYQSGSANDSSGIQSYSWSDQGGGGTINISAPSSSGTDLSGSGIAVDYTNTVRLTVMDNAGNSNSDDMLFTWDTLAPDPPVFVDYSVFEYPYNAYRAKEEKAFFLGLDWTQGGGDGVDQYSYRTPTEKDYESKYSYLWWDLTQDKLQSVSGGYAFSVGEYDAVGNLSDPLQYTIPYFFDQTTDDPRIVHAAKTPVLLSPFFFNQSALPLDPGSDIYLTFPQYFVNPVKPDYKNDGTAYSYMLYVTYDNNYFENAADTWLKAVDSGDITANNFMDKVALPGDVTALVSGMKITNEDFYNNMYQGPGYLLKDLGSGAIKFANTVYYWYYEVWDSKYNTLIATSPYYVFVSRK